LLAPLVAFFTTFLAAGALAAGALIAFSAVLGAIVSLCLIHLRQIECFASIVIFD
jgi:hypothetical protein